MWDLEKREGEEQRPGFSERRKGRHVDKEAYQTNEFRRCGCCPNHLFPAALWKADLRIDGEVLLQKVAGFTKEFKHDKAPSSAWVDRWNIRKISNVGEAGGVDQGVVTEWREVVINIFLLDTSQRMYLTVMKQACFGKCFLKKV